MEKNTSQSHKKMLLSITPPDRFYAEQLGFDLFERGRRILETGLLDVAFVLDSLVRIAESRTSDLPEAIGSAVNDRRFARFAAVWGTVLFCATR